LRTTPAARLIFNIFPVKRLWGIKRDEALEVRPAPPRDCLLIVYRWTSAAVSSSFSSVSSSLLSFRTPLRGPFDSDYLLIVYRWTFAAVSSSFSSCLLCLLQLNPPAESECSLTVCLCGTGLDCRRAALRTCPTSTTWDTPARERGRRGRTRTVRRRLHRRSAAAGGVLRTR
jgi:hypothetical protein